MAFESLVDRALQRRSVTRHFAAVAGPTGVHVVRYSRERGGLALDAGIRRKAPGSDVDGLADAIAEAVEALGGGEADLALALSGFGSAHHILSLPAADTEILRPIVRRELLRYYPDLEDPLIDFVFPAAAVAGESTNREMLVGAVPRRVATTLAQALRERGITLRHLTVLPQILQSLYDTFDGQEEPAVMVVVMESGTLIGCFHEGALRLFIEPPKDVHGRPVRTPDAVTEQVERANLFLRQQFPNVRVSRVLLAAPAGEAVALRDALDARLGSRVIELAEVPAGSLAALGTALAADRAADFELLPAELRPRTAAERLTRRLALVAAALVAAGATWWAGAGMNVARTQADEAQQLERSVSRVLPALNRAERVLEARRGHQLRLVFVEETAAARSEVRRILAGIAAEARPAVRLDTLTIRRSDGAWSVVVAGRAEAVSSAAAVRAIDGLYRGIADRLPVLEAEFGGMDGISGGGSAPVAIGFDMSFIVQWQTDLAR